MTPKLPNEEKHERIFCAYTHVGVAWALVALCALQVLTDWRNLNRPVERPNAFELLFYILFVVLCVPVFFPVFRCFAERVVLAIVGTHMAMVVVASLLPGVFDPFMALLNRAFLAAWVAAFLMSLRMPAQAMRNPYRGPSANGAWSRKEAGLLLLTVLAVLVIGALIYWIPFPR